MIDFIIKISNLSKQKNGNFLIYPQNGSQLLSNRSYLESINGIGLEDLFTLNNNKQEISSIKFRLNNIKPAIESNKTVFSIEYATNP